MLHPTSSTHEVYNLGIQDFAIKSLRAVPERYGAVVPNREVVITSIRVSVVE